VGFLFFIFDEKFILTKIIVSVSNNLINDQRVAKVCNSLYKNGFDIILIGRDFPKKDTTNYNTPYKIKYISLIFNKGILFYAEYNLRLFLLLLTTKKDLLLANDLDTLLPNFLASRIQNKKLVFDSHELFSEIPELVHKPKTKKIWLRLEKFIIPKLKNNYTVCKSIASHYKKSYNINFEVVRNLPLAKKVETSTLNIKTDKKIIIYQGAINIGRGLELMINTMHHLDDYLLLIVGSGDIINTLKTKIINESLDGKVCFYGKVTPSELHTITPNAVLGISFEEDLGLNYRYALPNKIFDYIQAEVPILISDLPEMKQIISKYKVGEIIKDRTPKAIAKQIKNLTNKDFTTQIEKAKEELIWKTDENILLNIFHNLR